MVTMSFEVSCIICKTPYVKIFCNCIFVMSILVWAFEGWKVFLIMDKVKESGFKRLLEAGAASVVMETELSLSTHAFVDTSHLKSSGNVRIQTHNHNIIDKDVYFHPYQVKMLTKLRSEGVTCLRPEYIACTKTHPNSLMNSLYRIQ